MNDDRIRILFITCFASLQGGGQRSLYLLLKHLDKKIFDPYLVVPGEGEVKEAVTELGIPCFVLPLPRIRSFGFFSVVRGFLGLQRIVRSASIDLICTDSVRETFYAGVVAKINRLGLILHLKVADSKPWIDQWLYFFADRMIAVSRAAAERFQDRQKKIDVVYNGVDCEVFQPPQQQPAQEHGVLKIGYFGHIEERKGIDIFIRAVHLTGSPFLEAHIFGDGEEAYVRELKTLVGDSPRIFFHGFREKPHESMARMDAVILPARRREGLSRSLIEAMAMGKAVVASSVPSNPELLGEPLKDFIFKSEDVEDLARLLRRLLEDREAVRSAGAAARRRAESLFDIRQNTKKIEVVYQAAGRENITSKSYDRRVLSQGLEFQVQAYYEPQDTSEQRRVAVVMEKLSVVSGEHILDVGCGVGTFVFHAAREGAIACGVDYSFESVRAARQLTARYRLAGRADFLCAAAISLPFGDGIFDKITAIDFIEHITHDAKAALLLEIRRVLKKDGLVVIYTPNKTREDIGAFYWMIRHFLFGHRIPKTGLHYGLITRRQFEKLLRRCGFSFVFWYHDVTRPLLAKIPFFRRYLSLNLLWAAQKIRSR